MTALLRRQGHRAIATAPRPIPVIVVTKFGTAASRQAALAAGAFACLAKPFATAAFTAIVFFLVPVGRGRTLRPLGTGEGEQHSAGWRAGRRGGLSS